MIAFDITICRVLIAKKSLKQQHSCLLSPKTTPDWKLLYHRALCAGPPCVLLQSKLKSSLSPPRPSCACPSPRPGAVRQNRSNCGFLSVTPGCCCTSGPENSHFLPAIALPPRTHPPRFSHGFALPFHLLLKRCE